MFDINKRYITRGIQQRLSHELTLYLWLLIDKTINSALEMDYLQVFKFAKTDDNQLAIGLGQEQPPRTIMVQIPMKPEYESILGETIFVIDDGDHSTMLFADEY